MGNYKLILAIAKFLSKYQHRSKKIKATQGGLGLSELKLWIYDDSPKLIPQQVSSYQEQKANVYTIQCQGHWQKMKLWWRN